MREVAIIGVGSTVFGKLPERLPYELGAEATAHLLREAGRRLSRAAQQRLLRALALLRLEAAPKGPGAGGLEEGAHQGRRPGVAPVGEEGPRRKGEETDRLLLRQLRRGN